MTRGSGWWPIPAPNRADIVRTFPDGAAMEFHLPGPIRNFKDFFIHLGIITLGILIALGLEQIVEARHRVKIGRDSMTSFRHELTENRVRVAEVIAASPHLREQIQTQIAAIAALGDSAGKTPVAIS